MNNGKTYKIVCPYCGKEQYRLAGMSREMGIDAGIGACIYCQELMILVYEDEQETMAAGKWERTGENK